MFLNHWQYSCALLLEQVHFPFSDQQQQLVPHFRPGFLQANRPIRGWHILFNSQTQWLQTQTAPMGTFGSCTMICAEFPQTDKGWWVTSALILKSLRCSKCPQRKGWQHTDTLQSQGRAEFLPWQVNRDLCVCTCGGTHVQTSNHLC